MRISIVSICVLLIGVISMASLRQPHRFTRVDPYPDGRVKGRGKESKITPTWMRSGTTWQIIGGMCGDLTPTGK